MSADPIRDGAQAALDEQGDGWSVSHYIAVVGIERVNAEGGIDTGWWYFVPASQPDYVTSGLLMRATGHTSDVTEETD